MSLRTQITSRIADELDERMTSSLNSSVNYLISGAAYIGGGSRYRSGVKMVSSGKALMKSGMPKKKILGIKLPKFDVPKINTAKITSGAIAINKGIARKTQGKIIMGFGYVWHKLH